MSDPFHQTLDVEVLRRAIAKIHEQVAGEHARIELTRAGCDDVCVILSKAELESLEQALEILSRTEEYRAMCQQLHRLALDCGALGAAADLLCPEAG